MNCFSRIRLFALSVVLFAGFTVGSAHAQATDPQVKSAMKLIELGNPEDAIADLKRLASPGKNAEAHAGLAIAYLEMNQVAQAQAEVQQAIDIDKKSVMSRVARAMLYGKQKNVTEALKEFAQALKINDKEIGTYLALSRYYFTLDSTKPAEVNLYRAQQVNDKDIRPYLGLGELYERQRIYDLAIQQYQEAKKLDPTDMTVPAKLAQLYFRARKYNESIDEWKNLMKIDSTYAPAYYQVGNIYYLAEKYPTAVYYAEKYTNLRPDDVFGHWLLARSLTESGQYSKALSALEKVASNDSLKSLSNLLLARSYFYNKEFAKANELFGASKNMSSYDLDFYGRSLVLSGDTTKGIEMLRASLENDTLRKPETKLETRRQIASFLYSQGRIAESAAEFAKIADEKPTVDAYITTAQIYGYGKEYDKSFDYYNRAIKMDPKSLKAHLGLVTMYASRGAEAAAGDAMESAANALIAASQNSKDTLGQAYSWLGYHYLVAKKLEQSVDNLEKALPLLDQKSPAFVNSTLMLAQAYHTKLDLKKAKEYYEKVIKLDPTNKGAKDGLDLIKKSTPGK